VNSSSHVPRIRAFLAASLDGFIAGPNDELDWLPDHGVDESEDTFTPFFAEIGAMLMGRRTFDVVSGFDGPWPYGEKPILVATSRPLQSTEPTVKPISGTISEMIDTARRTASGGDIYLDGGSLFRSTLRANLLDELTLTVVPVVLGAGIPLFTESKARRQLALESSREIGAGMVQLRYRVLR
jgi:dihydrofolate reductase